MLSQKQQVFYKKMFHNSQQNNENSTEADFTYSDKFQIICYNFNEKKTWGRNKPLKMYKFKYILNTVSHLKKKCQTEIYKIYIL